MKRHLLAAAVLSASSLLVSQLSLAEESAAFVERTLAFQQGKQAAETVAKRSQGTDRKRVQTSAQTDEDRDS
ncbi:hypothetical protein [Pseudomonas indica]|uniref:Secreted protein n=1 Tax=Pseudomonas indica TaxID=137658 RepID=A0A1G9PSR3_9PSED|nr:hypothetical protein [Pseudomonas indica]SDM01780.1 hypothetical protein SAMN05216186_1412 [Pseudomonas indica]